MVLAFGGKLFLLHVVQTGVYSYPLEQAAEIAENIDAREQEILALVEQGYRLKEARARTGYHHLQTKEA